MAPMDVGIIINPVSGRYDSQALRVRTRLAGEVLAAEGICGEVKLTDGRGSAYAIAEEMISFGAQTLVAWGGDGTINEVAQATVGAEVALGVVPGGSGNGFARGLGLQFEPRLALKTALTGPTRLIDSGEIAGRLFVNVAGIGFDAHLAGVFNHLRVRGNWAYFCSGIRELRKYGSSSYTVCSDRKRFTMDAFLVTIANGPEYGLGAMIAPMARFDDGVLDVISVAPRSLTSLLLQSRRLFSGTIHCLPDVRCISGQVIEISADDPLEFHVDGEVYKGTNRLLVRVRSSSLSVRVPPVQDA
tara:strand:+ start:4676 stop:5578 length:903 start_codon:yes stop_codon:yes gene_type:complete